MALVGLGEIMPLLDERSICLPAIDIAGGHPDFVLGTLHACEASGSPVITEKVAWYLKECGAAGILQ